MIQSLRVAWLVATAATLTACATQYVPTRETAGAMSGAEARQVVTTATALYSVDRNIDRVTFYSVKDVRLTSRKLTIVAAERFNKQERTFAVLFSDFDLSGPDPLHRGGICLVYRDGVILVLSTRISDEGDKRLADALWTLKQTALNGSPDDERRFEQTARSYRASAVKPALAEEARRFKIQAEGAVRDKAFEDAVDLYAQALEVAPWWPDGHFNRALVLSEIRDFPEAIRAMKRYLQLVPDAPDARAAQDKIYEWERQAGGSPTAPTRCGVRSK